MSGPARIGDDERRRRLAIRHRLVDRADSVEAAADAMVALHATDPATIFLSALARTAEPSIAAVEAALYDHRTLARTMAMRRTLWVATTAMLGTIEASSSGDVAATERKRLTTFLNDSGVDDAETWLDDAAAEVMDALDDGLPARSITKLVPRLATKLIAGAGTKNEVEIGATSRVLLLMALDGLLVRGRPSGAWTGRQYTWYRRDRWIDEPPTEPEPEPDEAAAALVGAWLGAFGPATFDDLRWWTGWTVGKTKAAVAANPVEEVVLEGEVAGLVLAGDTEPTPDPGPWAALLPSLDPTAMGWKERAWYVGDHTAALFDRNGNIGPTVWVDGRIVGGWCQNPDGEIRIGYLEEVGADRQALVDAEADRLTAADRRRRGQTVVPHPPPEDPRRNLNPPGVRPREGSDQVLSSTPGPGPMCAH